MSLYPVQLATSASKVLPDNASITAAGRIDLCNRWVLSLVIQEAKMSLG